MIRQKLPRPFLSLAPMEGFTDTVFRTLVTRWGKPDLFYTEFVRADRVSHSPRLQFSPQEQPIIAQLWGSRPDEFGAAAGTIESKGFHGIDVNLGCPMRKIRRAQGGAALVGRFDLVGEIVRRLSEATDLPISVKTRLGATGSETEEWFRFLFSLGVSAVTIHARTTAQLYYGIPSSLPVDGTERSGTY